MSSRPQLPKILADDVAVRHYLAATMADNTKRAYQSDLNHFAAWGGVIPATPETVAKYLVHYAETLAVATLRRRMVAIGRAHEMLGLPLPTATPLIKSLFKGITRSRRQRQRQVAAVSKQQLMAMLKGLSGMRGLRDKALLLIGFAAALRRSELVALDVADVKFLKEGVVLAIRRSKTDQDGKGHYVTIPHVSGRYSPCKVLKTWIEQAGIKRGPIFRRVRKGDQVTDERLSGQAVSLILKQRVSALGIDAQDYSGHSLRAGFVTSSVQAGASSAKIMKQTRHQSEAMMQRYVRTGQDFMDHPLQSIWTKR